MRIHVAACLSASLLALVASLGGGGCSSSSGSCAAEGTVTVSVTNQVDSDNNYVCNADVTITPTTGGGSAQTLTPQGLDGSTANCVYVVNVKPGSYTLTANADGYQTGMDFITVQEVGCVTSSPEETIALIPTLADEDGGADEDADVIRDAALE